MLGWLLLVPAVAMVPVVGPCEATALDEAAIVVETAAHRLHLCRRGEAVTSYDVSLGRGGDGKEAQGDGRTPLGRYTLGKPYRSAKFGLFVPIGYPTQAQRRKGMTGDAVGIHGPTRKVRWLTRLFDWTAGCVAVGSDGEIEEIARWVRRSGAGAVVIVR